MIRGVDGRKRESDASALLGADGKARLVTIKSVSTVKATKTSLRKAADQLALRNMQRNGQRRSGVIVVGYQSQEVYDKLLTKNWQASADRTGARLLVLAIDQHTGKAERLAAVDPDPQSSQQPKMPKALPSIGDRVYGAMLSQIGRRSPKLAHRIHRGVQHLRAKTAFK